ncbi:unnamed protein product [Bursaphelenchus okinawaensis]|uniref:Ornithine decarboxylase antizyme n=1 Tax=Bursaphelenchus okinawaensis TaxID=465554 RepID=A0A811JR11_9BILA|nr:unnamed protein product [Bursaphelenchus okinawaensis]CAG9078767.1 unnamed protein product [Bursaphelenchus okinawaensis]
MAMISNMNNSNSMNFCSRSDSDALSGLVKQVSEEWCAHIPEKKTLALFLPHNQHSSKLSREHFVNLLEYCEDELGFCRVLACFNKDGMDAKQGIPRALRCIGFNVLAPEHFPASLDKQKLFCMVYNI